MGFADSVKKWADKALVQANDKTCDKISKLLTNVVVESPSPSNPGQFAKGLLANQWYTALGSAYSTALTAATNDYGADSLARIKSTLAQKPFLGQDNVVTFSNNVPHVYLAEVLGWQPGARLGMFPGGWTNNVDPYRMVKKSVDKFKAGVL